MAFARPSLKDLIARTVADLVARLELQGSVLRRAAVRVLATVWSGLVHSLHGHLDYTARQILVSTADGDGLDDHGADFQLPRLAATYAVGSVTLTGTNGSDIPAGTRVQRTDGVEYSTDVDAVVAGGTATVAATAVLAGADGNADAATVLNLVEAVPGIDAGGTVAAGGMVGGADTESHDDYRARLLDRKRNTPQGGADSDYIAWAKEIAGVTRVWVYPLELGAGTVTVRFVRDNDASPIPDAGEVTAVANHIATKRPVTAQVTVVAPVANPVAITLHINPDTPAIRAAVTAELAAMFKADAEPGTTILLSHINEAISLATGEDDHVLTVPAANVPMATGQFPTLGVITWT
jgi:uncharacterized phage protein gp47/JayE